MNVPMASLHCVINTPNTNGHAVQWCRMCMGCAAAARRSIENKCATRHNLPDTIHVGAALHLVSMLHLDSAPHLAIVLGVNAALHLLVIHTNILHLDASALHLSMSLKCGDLMKACMQRRHTLQQRHICHHDNQ